MRMTISRIYTAIVLKRPLIICLLIGASLVFWGFQARYFKLDASADSLLLDNDKDLKLFRETHDRYGNGEFLFVAFTPKADLFSPKTIEHIRLLRDELSMLPAVESVISLVDVPLLGQVDGTLSDIADNVRTLGDDNINIQKAAQELLNSPLYKELIISADGTTTALQVNLKKDAKFAGLLKARNELIYAAAERTLTESEASALAQIKRDYADRKKRVDQTNHENIAAIREILKKYEDYGTLHLGGVPMIADDMITFIKNDLIVFGTGIFLFLVGMLTIIFRKPRWVILPLLSCLYTGLFMLGFLGLVGWNITVISSNFISLMLIITMSMNIHLIVRYRQLCNDRPRDTQQQLVFETVRKMVWPCFYTALTTIIAFTSLIVSGIRPVIDFGLMMTIGLTVTFLTSFILFPALLVLMPKYSGKPPRNDKFQLNTGLAVLTEKHGGKILILSLLLAVISAVGISRLEVENSFINYFSKDTDIYQGLYLIDRKLGGTTPLDIILTLEEPPPEKTEMEDLEALFSNFEPEEKAWFTPERVDTIKLVHDYFDSLPEVGKVLSLASIIRVGEIINKGEFDAFELAIVGKRMPETLKRTMIKPYVSEENDEARISVRILDSLGDLRRAALLDKIRVDMTKKLQLDEGSIQITGLFILYNNMLQSLFRSQILTLGFVMAGIALMLLVLFRSITLALIGIIPNVLAAAIILGSMGLFGIPLDMMTITIAAITIGIAVDNCIHYIYRFREEFPNTGEYVSTMRHCHANIGKAIFYTAITIIVGFSILMLSNFIPTIYFGLLTALAMLIALCAALTLLPKLILIWKPFK